MSTAQEKAANLKKAFAENDIPWPKTRTLYWNETGPLMNYCAGMLLISDLNPEKHIQWRMSRWEMLRLGLRCIRAALGRKTG